MINETKPIRRRNQKGRKTLGGKVTLGTTPRGKKKKRVQSDS